ncbi:MAG: hypothetical protein JWM57_1060 [Phycisphaerales bacterium]|nr:hypothetical protein [Phycisphaerales bacterium]
MRKMKSAALAVLLASCGFASADVLEKLPADALVAGKVANLTATSTKLAKLAKDLGIDAFVQPLQNPLAALKTEAHFEKGLNESGDFGIALMTPKDDSPGAWDAAVVMVVPVSNYAEFLTNFTEPKTEGGISQVSMANDPKPLFVADWDGYAAISPNKDNVAKPAKMMTPTAATAKEAARQDFIIVTNFKELGPKLMPKLDKALADIATEAAAHPDRIDPKYKPLATAAVLQAFAAAKTFLNSTDATTIGLNITDAGMNTTVLSDFRADSYLGQMAMSAKGTDKPLTVGLPAMKYLVYGGSMMDPAASAKLFNDLAAPIIAELEKIEGLGDVKKLVAETTAVIGKSTGTTFGMPVLTKPGQEGILQQITVYHGSGKEMKTLATDGGAVAKQFIADYKMPEGQPKMTFEQLVNDKSIEGVSFDTIKFDAPVNPDAPQAAMQQQMKAVMYGPNGMTYSYAAIGEDFVMVNGASDETIGAFLKSLKANEDNLSKLDQVKVVAAELPKTRVVEYYVALDELVNVGVGTAAQFGLPIQVQLPPDLPPLGVTFGAEQNTMRMDFHLPTTTVQSLIAAGMQTFMAMRGGGGNL